MYFNLINKRSGALFQGKYKASHVDNDRYLKYLISYIHLNPISLVEPEWTKNGIQDFARAEHYLDEFAFSSYFLFSSRPEKPPSNGLTT